MKLSTKGKYAVMALIDIAMHTKEDNYISLVSISRRNGISVLYLEQLFIKLRRSGLVSSTKGPKGGYILAKDPKDINILDIVKAVDEEIDIVSCNSKSGCMADNGGIFCNSHDLWYNLMINIHSYLSSISLEVAVAKVDGKSTEGMKFLSE